MIALVVPLLRQKTQAPLPRKLWQLSFDPGLESEPTWSPDGRMLYFISNRSGVFNVWGIRFDLTTGQPVGEPFRVTPFESPGQMILEDVRTMELALTADRLMLPLMEVTGNIWVLENVGQ